MKGDVGGPWGVLGWTWPTLEGPEAVPYEFQLDGIRAIVRAGDLYEVESEPIRNPVTGAEITPGVTLPQGTIFKQGTFGSSKRLKMDRLGIDYENKYTAVAAVRLRRSLGVRLRSRTAHGAERRLDFVEVLAPVRRAQRRRAGCQGRVGQRRSTGRVATRASVSSAISRASRATSRGGIAWISARLASLIQSTSSGSVSEVVNGSPRSSLSASDEHPGVPERDVAEHGRDRPVRVHRDAELVLAHALDDRAHPLALSRVLLDVGAIVRHASVDDTAGAGRSGSSLLRVVVPTGSAPVASP